MNDTAKSGGGGVTQGVKPATHRSGRPRSDTASRAILDATRELIVQHGYTDLHLERVAAKAGVGKTTIYRRWSSKEALVLDLAMELAAPHIIIGDTDDTRREMLAAVNGAARALTTTAFGPVVRALLSQIAVNPRFGDRFRATVVQARRDEIAAVIARGIVRGDLRADVAADIATELLVGPVYFRLIFGGELTDEFAEAVVDSVLRGFAQS